MPLDRLHAYGFGELGVAEGALDGPFILPDGGFGLLVSLKGKDGGAMPSPSELTWGRDIPTRARTEPIHVFFRAGEEATYLGVARVAGRGRPANDGYQVKLGLVEPLNQETWRRLVDRASAPPLEPEEAVTKLTTPSSTSDRVGALQVFAHRWFGCSMEALPMVVSCGPALLGVLHGIIAGGRICTQNKLVAPEDLERSTTWHGLEEVDDKVIFYVENQGVCVWATEPEGDDPPVYRRMNEWNAAWVRESETLSGFFIEMLLLEAVYGAPFGARDDGLDARELANLAKRVLPVPIEPWAASGTHFYGYGGVIGFSYADGERFHVELGARDRLFLEPLEELVADWSDVGF